MRDAREYCTCRNHRTNGRQRLAAPFPSSAACKFLDLPPVNLRNLQLHLAKNSLASRPPLLCGASCTDTQCPCHPVNHDRGCDLCIRKNLRQREIPSCFFHDIGCEKPTPDWHYADFAALVDKAKGEGRL